jgi:hypothetical protein
MKKFLLAIATVFSVASASAQMASGSVCPNFTGTDLDGQTWNLYDLLDQGYSVVVDVSATWCGPCWNYHNSGALDELYTAHGPDGTNEVRVLFVEGDAATTNADLHGTGTNTQGDWVANTPYPIIDDASIGDLLQITYFPTIYTICPSRIITETGQITADMHYEFISSNGCESATMVNDPSLIGVTATGGNCGNADVTLNVTLQNFGTEPLTSATIVVYGGISPVTTNWTGSLATYATEEISIGVPTSGSVSLDVMITSSDGNTSNNTVNVVAGLANATTWWNVNLHTDCWPEEVSWEVVDGNGTNVMSSPVYAATDADESSSFQLPSTGCYTFLMYDAYGDGMFGSQYAACGVDGSVLVWTDLGTVYSYGIDTPAHDLSEEQKSASATLVGVEETSTASGFSVYPNPSNGMVNLTFSLKNEANVTLDVLNSVGEKVIARNIGSRVSGDYRMPLDLNELSAGIYMVSLNVNGVSTVTRITVTK